jgi:hypothetical protein
MEYEDKYSKFNDCKIFKTYNDENTIILNEHFLFIQIPKTSSTTVLHCCKKQSLVSELPCYRHEGLLYLENFIENKLPVFAVVRNPFTQIFSYFFHRIKYKELILDNNLSLKENFEKFVVKEINNNHLRQSDYIRTKKRTSVFLIKFEDKNIIDILNSKFNLNFSNEKINNNDISEYIEAKKNIKSFFENPDIVKLILTERKKEFELFGYSKNVNDISN